VPSQAWKISFDAYIRNLPYYYVNPLRLALKQMSIQNAVPDQVDGTVPFQLLQHIKKLTTTVKMETDRFEELMAAAASATSTPTLTADPQLGPSNLFEVYARSLLWRSLLNRFHDIPIIFLCRPRVRLLVELDRLRAGFAPVPRCVLSPVKV
jgi:hypothetical protein